MEYYWPVDMIIVSCFNIQIRFIMTQLFLVCHYTTSYAFRTFDPEDYMIDIMKIKLHVEQKLKVCNSNMNT